MRLVKLGKPSRLLRPILFSDSFSRLTYGAKACNGCEHNIVITTALWVKGH